MRQIVKDSFFDYTAKREGFTPFLYCDTLNLVTTGVGNLVDNGARNGFDISDHAMAPALNLTWFTKGPGWTKNNPVIGAQVGLSAVKEAWITTKLHEQRNPGFILKGGFAYTNLTNITLSMDGLRNLFARTLSAFDSSLAKRYPGYENWPADAQLAILSMSWAMGPAFNFPEFKSAVDREDFMAAIPHAFFKGGGSLQDPKSRNAAHVIMLTNAANVVKAGADRNQLFFPGTSDSPAGVSDGGTILAGAGTVGTKKGLLIGLEALTITGAIGAVGYGLYELRKNMGRKSRA